MNTLPELRPAPIVQLGEKLFATNEAVHPTGSIKYRIALYMTQRAIAAGKILRGTVIIEATSGNTGIAFAQIAEEVRCRMIAVMPCNMTDERKAMLRSLGAHVEQVGPSDFAGAVLRRDELVLEYGKEAFCPNQFCNPQNADCHDETTGSEIVRYAADTLKQPIAAFVAGTGTGGTLMGAGRRIRKEYPSSKIVAVEPAESTAMSNPNNLGEHQISGIGDGFIPEIVQMSEVSRIAVISSRDAIGRTRELHRAGLHVGISSGANVLAAERYIQDVNPDGVVFTVLPDSANRYERLLSDYR